MSQSKNTSHVFGSIDIMHFADLNNTRISGLASPIELQDAANKDYVDSNILASNLTGGVGITVNTSNNTINANPSQTQIVELGNIHTGTWTANTIQIPYGGTGQTNFTVNKLIFYNNANRLASVPEFTYDSITINSSIPLVCSNTTDTTNILSSTGSLIVRGGANITKRLYVHGNSVFNADITVGNLTINGVLNLSNSAYSNITTGGLTVDQYFTSNSSNSFNLFATNTTLANVIIISNTTSNELVTNTLTVPNLGIFGTINSSFISTGNLISFSSYTTNTSSANTTTTNLRVTSAIITNANINTSTTQNLLITNLLTSVNSNLITLINTTGNLVNLINTNSTINNLINTNITSNTGYINTISTGNLQGTNSTITNFNVSNITATNSNLTNTSIGILFVTGNSTLSNLGINNITVANIFLNTLFTSNLNNQTSTTIGRLDVTGLAICSTINSTSISTGTLYSNLSENNSSSIGTLNVSQNINNSNGTILTDNVTSNNLYASNLSHTQNLLSTNLTTTNLRSTGIAIQATVISTNISTGTLNVAGLSNTLNFNTTNSTINNNFVVNQTTNNLRVTSSTESNTVITNSTIANSFISNANITTSTTSNLLVSRILNIVGNYQGPTITTAGSFFTVLPSTFINTIASDSSVPNWYPNYINSSTLSAVNNNIITNKVANFYIRSNVLIGGNQTVNYNSAMTIGYVPNVTSGNLNTQLSFERSDGLPIGGIYMENFTNKLIVMNGSLSGGGGFGIHTVKNTPITFSSIQSSTTRDPQDYVKFLDTTTTFYSTTDSNSTTTGSVLLYGGLGVDKTITSQSIKTQNLEVEGALTQSGYGLFNILSVSHQSGDSNIEFTNGNFSSGISTNIHPFTIGASIILENVITFQFAGIYNIKLRLNNTTNISTPTLIQTHVNKFISGNWEIYQSCSHNLTFESNTDIVNDFMIDVQANEHIKFTISNGHLSDLTIDSDSKKSRLIIHKVG